jgi:hypothetical protein
MLLEEESPNHRRHTGMDLRCSLGSPVIIVQVRSHSPDSGSFQFSQSPAKVNVWSRLSRFLGISGVGIEQQPGRERDAPGSSWPEIGYTSEVKRPDHE